MTDPDTQCVRKSFALGGRTGVVCITGAVALVGVTLSNSKSRAVMVGGKKAWLDWMGGLCCADGCGDTFAGIEGAGIVGFEIDPGSLGPDGWYEKNMRSGALIGPTVCYDTPDPSSTGYYAACYRVHWMGDEPDWGKWEYDDDDDGVGNDDDQIDMVELTICSVNMAYGYSIQRFRKAARRLSWERS